MDYSVMLWQCPKGHEIEISGDPFYAINCDKCDKVYPVYEGKYITNVRKEVKDHLQFHRQQDIAALDPNEHYAKHLNLTTISADNHCLSITDTQGQTQVFYLTVQQCLHLAYQAIQSLWTFYKIVPK